MPPLKLYYLSAEVAPFSETYELASFSRKITSKLHDKIDIDILWLNSPEQLSFFNKFKYAKKI